MRTPTLTIRPRRGVRTPRYGSKPIVAIVDLDPGRSRYSHPTVRLATLDLDGDLLQSFEIRYQRHRKSEAYRASDGIDYGRYPGGFLGERGVWSQCYGAELSARLWDSVPRFLRRCLDVLDRALDAAREHRRARRSAKDPDCDLLSLIVGLRLIGVEVRILSPDHEARRASWKAACAVDAARDARARARVS